MSGTFYGWYMKCQSDTQTLAVIPAVHECKGERTCSIQIITEDDARNVVFRPEEFRRLGKSIRIGQNRFGQSGLRLRIRKPGLTVDGELEFGALLPLQYDIMGPFALVPFMECRHNVWSMRHTVNGEVRINDKVFAFRDAEGYWEGDEGRSFPRRYAWTQSFFEGGSLMLSVADIPLAGFCFTGIIGVIMWRGKEYRIATYLGARVRENKDGVIVVKQGGMELMVRLPKGVGWALKAPVSGDMTRTIREGAACRVFYRFRAGQKTVFEFETERASFEYEY